MKFYIEGFPAYYRELEMDSLDDILTWINNRLLGKMEYRIFTGKPYTFENLIYQHLVD